MRKITTNHIIQFKNNLINEEKSSSTINKYVHDIIVFKAWCNDVPLTKQLVLKYKNELIEKYAPASVNATLSSINSFFVFQEWFDLKVKSLRIQKQLFANEERDLTKEEYQRLLSAAKNKGNKRLYTLMQTICATGIRVSELKYITVENIRNKKAVIHLKGKTRVIIIPNELCSILLKYAKERQITTGCVFISKNGKPLDRSNIWADMKKLCISANVSKEKVFPHNLRHLFARTFYSVQKDIVRLADILGHSSVNTTRIYTMETGEIHRRQIQKLGLLRC